MGNRCASFNPLMRRTLAVNLETKRKTAPSWAHIRPWLHVHLEPTIANIFSGI